MGGFPEDAWWGEDADLWGKIALNYPIAFSWELGAIYHWDALDRACCRPSLEQEPFVKTGKQAIAENIIPKEVLPDFIEYVNKKEIYRAACNIIEGNPEISRRVLTDTNTRLFYPQKILLTLFSFLPQKIARSLVRFFLNR